MSLHTRVAGTWREVAEAHVRVSGAWRKAKVHTRVAGVWEDVLPIIALNGELIYHFAIGTAIAGVRFNPDGTVDKREGGTYTQIDSTTDWCVPNSLAPGNYEIRATLVSGTDPGEPLNTWLALTSSREWNNAESNGFTETVLDFDIRLGALIVATGRYTIQSESS